MGNDIVDLQEEGVSGKSRDARYLARIFTENEQQSILTSDRPDETLWMIWAAKESAYKIVSKLSSPPVFAHKKFETTLLEPVESNGGCSSVLQVTYSNIVAKITIEKHEEYIYSVGDAGSDPQLQGNLIFSEKRKVSRQDEALLSNKNWRETSLSGEEWKTVSHPESILVRIYCKQMLARRLQIDPSRMQIIRPYKNNRPQPPYLLIDGGRCEIDISLTHHGRWLAWCCSIPRNALPA